MTRSTDVMSNNKQIAIMARDTAKTILDTATQGGGAVAPLKAEIVKLAAEHPTFVECLIGELALEGVKRHVPHSSSYQEAEIAARLALSRFIPELAVSCIVESGRA